MKSGSDIEYTDLLKGLKRLGMSGMLPLYRQHRDAYLSFASHYTTDRDLRLQSFNDAIVQLYKAIVHNKYDAKKSHLKTYLYNLGKNNLINKLEKENTYNKHILLDHEVVDVEHDIPVYDTGRSNHMKWKTELNNVIDDLGDKCQQMILYFYYDALDAEEIMKLMKYDSVKVVYSTKSRCLKKLRELIIKNRARI